ncbi:KICSTOR complex protein C12orf66 [Pelomyxa schiedti]|nr:KICSTOR complex protein C12orf66 [Pelomyxa schiedti]
MYPTSEKDKTKNEIMAFSSWFRSKTDSSATSSSSNAATGDSSSSSLSSTSSYSSSSSVFSSSSSSSGSSVEAHVPASNATASTESSRAAASAVAATSKPTSASTATANANAAWGGANSSNVTATLTSNLFKSSSGSPSGLSTMPSPSRFTSSTNSLPLVPSRSPPANVRPMHGLGYLGGGGVAPASLDKQTLSETLDLFFTHLSRKKFEIAARFAEICKGVPKLNWSQLFNHMLVLATAEKDYHTLAWQSSKKKIVSPLYHALHRDMTNLVLAAQKRLQALAQPLIAPPSSREPSPQSPPLIHGDINQVALIEPVLKNLCTFLQARIFTSTLYESLANQKMPEREALLQELKDTLIPLEAIDCKTLSNLVYHITTELQILNRLVAADILISEVKFLQAMLVLNVCHKILSTWPDLELSRKQEEEHHVSVVQQWTCMPLYQLMWVWFFHETSKVRLVFRTPLHAIHRQYEEAKSKYVGNSLYSTAAIIQDDQLPNQKKTTDFIAQIETFLHKNKAHSVWIIYEKPSGVVPEYNGYLCLAGVGSQELLIDWPTVFVSPESARPHYPCVISIITMINSSIQKVQQKLSMVSLSPRQPASTTTQLSPSTTHTSPSTSKAPSTPPPSRPQLPTSTPSNTSSAANPTMSSALTPTTTGTTPTTSTSTTATTMTSATSVQPSSLCETEAGLLLLLEQLQSTHAPSCYYDNKEEPQYSYFVQQVFPGMQMVVVFNGKKGSRDKSVVEFISTFCATLKNERLFDDLKQHGKSLVLLQ